MTSRVLFSNLLKGNIKRRIWVIAILLLIVLLLGPLVLITTFENSRYALSQTELVTTMVSKLSPNWLREFIFTAPFSVLIAFSGFSYVFSKNQLDLYHSVPLKREKLFFVNYLSGIIIQLFLLLVMTITHIVVAAGGKYLTFEAWKNIGLTFVGDLVIFIFFYNVAVLAIMLTGNLIVGLLGDMVLCGLYPAIVGIVNGLISYCFVTYHYSEGIRLNYYVKNYGLSPVSAFSRYIVQYGEGNSFASDNQGGLQFAIFVFCTLLAAFIVLFMAFRLYLGRKSEAAGKSIAITKSESFIRIPIVIMGGLICCLIMGLTMTKFLSGWMWFALIAGCVLTHFVMEMIFNLDYKAFYKNWIQMLVTVAVTLIIFTFFAFDFTGYDKFIPNQSNISKATICFFDIDNDLNYMTLRVDQDGKVETEYCGREMFMYKHIFDNPEMIEKIYNAAKTGVSFVDDMKNNRNQQDFEEIVAKDVYINGESEKSERGNLVIASPDETEDKRTFNITFVLNNGRVVSREYTIPFEALSDMIGDIYNTEEFRLAHFDIYDAYEEGVIDKVEVFDQFSEKQLSVTNKEVNMFMDIYLDELKKSTIKDIMTPPVASVNAQFMTKYNYEEGFYGYYIYPSFTKTLDYMKSLNVNMQNMTEYPDSSLVQNISINAYSYLYDEDKDESVSVDGFVYSANDPHGKEMIEEICDKAKLCNYGWSNSSFLNREDRVEMTVFYGIDGGIQKSAAIYFKKGDVPEEINKDLIEYAYEH